jgi:CubicO group peptidase (beta-lactamase class C family)
MLLRHEAGIPHRVTTDLEESAPRTAAEMVELASKQDLLFEPGTGETYSSGGYAVMARVLELASGKSFSELLAEHVFAPAGMKESVHPSGHNLIENRASSYQFTARGELVNSPLRNYSFLVGAGSIFSTAGDLVRLMKTAVSGGFGEPATGVLMRNGSLSWNGRTDGYRAFADYHPESDLYIGFVSNVLTGAGDLIRRDLPLIVAGEDVALPVVPRHEPVEVAAATLTSYEGDYELRPGSTLTLSVENGEVSMSGWLLIPTSETSFFSPQDYGEIKVVKDEAGGVERLDWIVAGQAYPMPRVDTPSN